MSKQLQCLVCHISRCRECYAVKIGSNCFVSDEKVTASSIDVSKVGGKRTVSLKKASQERGKYS